MLHTYQPLKVKIPALGKKISGNNAYKLFQLNFTYLILNCKLSLNFKFKKNISEENLLYRPRKYHGTRIRVKTGHILKSWFFMSKEGY